MPFLSYGFRPFFLLGALWAAVSMVLWICMLTGHLYLATDFDAVSWHAHEFLYGYLSAIIAGFLLTAVPSWTGRKPLSGMPLAGLVMLWVIGRIVIMISSHFSPFWVAAIDIAMPLMLGLFVAREIALSRNWKNLIILVAVGGLIAGNVLFHIEAANGNYAAGGLGLRIGLASVIMMIAVIGGRIIPAFTRNYLSKIGVPNQPASFSKFDILALVVLLTGLVLWVVEPQYWVTILFLFVIAGFHFVRMLRWSGYKTVREPLVSVLHLAYLFLPVGALAMAMSGILPDHLIDGKASQHIWMLLCIGLMTMAMLTRVSLGHTGRPLTAHAGVTLIYILIVMSGLSRLAASVSTDLREPFLILAAVCWVGGFGCFTIFFSKILTTKRQSH